MILHPLVLIDYFSSVELTFCILVDLTPTQAVDGGDLFKVSELSKQKL